MSISNEKILQHQWLTDMYQDAYFPKFLVDKIKAILLDVCETIEKQQPTELEQLYKITNQGVEKINDLESEFDDNGSELETVARDCMGMDFEFIAKAYGYDDADVEALISARDW